MRRGAAVVVLLVGCKSAGPPSTHRASDVACPLGAPVSASPCTTAADCPASARVACLAYDDAGIEKYCNADACHLDSDCADGGVCMCGTLSATGDFVTPNACLPAGNCRLDSECVQTHACSLSSVGCGTSYAYYCHTSGDECGSDTDCRDTQFCQYSPNDKRWKCESAVSCDG